MIGGELDAIRTVALDYVEGMAWGDMDRLRRCFHPRGLQVGHFRGDYEFLTGEATVLSVKQIRVSAGQKTALALHLKDETEEVKE